MNAGELVQPGGQSGPGRLLDWALDRQVPLVERRVAQMRRNRPTAAPLELVKVLNREFRSATITMGAGVGVAAAAPGVGTAAALMLSTGEIAAFMNATVLYVLARSEVQGISLQDVERRRTLVMAIMLGEAGMKSIESVAERTGQHWARQLVKAIPAEKVVAVNKVLGRNFVTKYGTTEGIIVLGRVAPFGIGAVIGGGMNAFLGQGIITASNRAFGTPSRS